MTLNPLRAVIFAVLTIGVGTAYAGQNQAGPMEVYLQQGVVSSDPLLGRKLWFSVVINRSCTSCHANDAGSAGKHIKTGKAIQPMALSANPERYRNFKKTEKWFLRNCKWTFGRECSVQEKADILTWLSGQ